MDAVWCCELFYTNIPYTEKRNWLWNFPDSNIPNIYFAEREYPEFEYPESGFPKSIHSNVWICELVYEYLFFDFLNNNIVS